MRGRNSHQDQEGDDKVEDGMSPIAADHKHPGKNEAGDDGSKFHEAPQSERDCVWKEQSQVLRPAVAKLPEAAVHAGADRIASVTEGYSVSRGLDLLRQCDVF